MIAYLQSPILRNYGKLKRILECLLYHANLGQLSFL